MSTCEHPVVAVSLGKFEEKHKLKFFSCQNPNFNLKDLKIKYGSENVFLLPCGRCSSCRQNYAQEWAVRCTCESYDHPYNYFLTLTYNNESVNYFDKSDMTNFIKRMRKYDSKLKYFYSLEFGDLTSRPHYHVILFMSKALDLYDGVNLHGFNYFHSKVIDKKWTFGLYNVAEFQHNCAAYVAKYTGKGSSIFMSRNLGKNYFLEHKDEIISNNFKLYGSFGDKSYIDIPRYFALWFGDDCKEFTENKKILTRSQVLRSMYDSSCIQEDVIQHNSQSLAIEKNNKKKGVRNLL